MYVEVCDRCGCDIGKLYHCDGLELCYDCAVEWNLLTGRLWPDDEDDFE